MSYNFESLNVGDSSVGKDLKVNFERLITDGKLSPDLAIATVIATATASNNQELVAWATAHAEVAGLTHELVQDSKEVAGIMGMLNMYYRFRHFLGEAANEYGPAGIRMTSLAKPAMGKEKFETLALAVSIINGCEQCVTSHEKALRNLGVSVDVLHDVARLSSVVKGLEGYKNSQAKS